MRVIQWHAISLPDMKTVYIKLETHAALKEIAARKREKISDLADRILIAAINKPVVARRKVKP